MKQYHGWAYKADPSKCSEDGYNGVYISATILPTRSQLRAMRPINSSHSDCKCIFKPVKSHIEFSPSNQGGR